MSGVGARAAGARHDDAGRGERNPRTPAQWYCLIFGATLLLVGILGFLANSTFDTGRHLQEDPFIGIFDVNGWHNVVHIASGIFLLAMSPRRASARAGAIAFGVVYGIVTIVGFIDGTDVFAFIPTNAADNVLHLVISALGIISGLISKGTYDDARDRGVVGSETRTAARV
jgi:purine-cytosine permease-like protein